MKAPPLLISYSSIQDYFGALQPQTMALSGDALLVLHNKGLPPVDSLVALSVLFGYSSGFLKALSERPERFYRVFEITSGAKKRTIHAPRVGLKVFQKWFGHHLALATPVHESVYGFVRGRSPVAAASKHCGASWVYSVDIKDFFQTTPSEKISHVLLGCGYSADAALLIEKLCSYGGFLAQGSPASPVLSNLIFNSLDVEISNFCSTQNISYTRYADDLVFSGQGGFRDELRSFVRDIVTRNGWILADQKELLVASPLPMRVHGLLVNGQAPRLPKNYRKKIRAFRYMARLDRVVDEDKARINGHIAYAESVERFNEL